MSKQKRGWQETEYLLSVFGNTPAAARRSYAAYVKAGYGQGRLRIQVAARSLLCYWAVRRAGTYGHRISQAPWADATRGELSCHPRRANRQREELQFSLLIF